MHSCDIFVGVGVGVGVLIHVNRLGLFLATAAMDIIASYTSLNIYTTC